MSDTTPYERMGGEAGLRRLVDRFYDLMDERPEAETIRRLHPEDLTSSRDKLFMFLSGWFGGPPLYMQRYGHPRLRARHLPFSIGEAERDEWLACMAQALDEMGLDPELHDTVWNAFHQMADHMRNRDL